MTGVTAIVPVWNRHDLLQRALSGLRAQTQPVDEIVVVDDGSVDPAQASGARIVRLDRHSGFAPAVNEGIRQTHTPLVAIVNNDVDLSPNWLERLLAGLRPQDWFATGKILQADDRTRIDATFDALSRGGTAWRVGFGCLDGPSFDEPRDIHFAPFTAALFRTELFDKAGLLDEHFESYLEDVDFCLRCALAGYGGRYIPSALAWHQGSATLGRWHPETTRRLSRNQVFLVAKHFQGRYIWPVLIAQTLWGLVALRHGRFWSWLTGKVEGLRRARALARGPLLSPSNNLSSILNQSEQDIRRAHTDSTRNVYWTLYFLLTATGAK